MLISTILSFWCNQNKTVVIHYWYTFTEAEYVNENECAQQKEMNKITQNNKINAFAYSLWFVTSFCCYFFTCLFVPACIKCDDLLYEFFSSLHDFRIAKQIDRLVSCLVKHTICDYMIIIITLPRLKPMPVMHVGALTARYAPKSITTWTPNDRHCTQPFRNKNIKFWFFFQPISKACIRMPMLLKRDQSPNVCA